MKILTIGFLQFLLLFFHQNVFADVSILMRGVRQGYSATQPNRLVGLLGQGCELEIFQDSKGQVSIGPAKGYKPFGIEIRDVFIPMVPLVVNTLYSKNRYSGFVIESHFSDYESIGQVSQAFEEMKVLFTVSISQENEGINLSESIENVRSCGSFNECMTAKEKLEADASLFVYIGRYLHSTAYALFMCRPKEIREVTFD
jgi:hypothetical protein